MYRHVDRFSRGGVGGQDPPRRRRFRDQYVRRRTPSGGYRGGSFSDDRNDSSPPPPIQSNRPVPVDEPSTYGQQQPSLYPPRQMQRPPQQQQQGRGPRHQARGNQGFNYRNYNDNNNYPRQMSQRTNEASDNDQVEPAQSESFPSGGKKFVELNKTLQSQKTEIDEMRSQFSKLTTELDQIKTRVRELESSLPQGQSTSKQTVLPVPREGGDWNEQIEKDKRRKSKLLKQREKKAAKLAEKRAAISENASQSDKKILNPEQVKPLDSNSTQNVAENDDQTAASTSKISNRRTNRERNTDRRVRRELKEKPQKPLPKVNRSNVNDDSTTQAAEPSSEDRPEGDDGREGGTKEKVRVFRRKKQHFGRQGYNNRRRRADSSERNSNDTSPQGDANGNADYKDKRKRNTKPKTYAELSELELNTIVQTLKREFLNSEKPLKALKATMNTKGPVVGTEFATSILDHAICDVTSPTKLSEIANSLYLLLVSDDNTSELDFQRCFFNALKDISKREDDIAIDAPRYMDTLGQVLADCILPMNTKHRHLVKKFFNGCLTAYLNNKAVLLASIMKAIASTKNDRFAKDIWDVAQLKWENFLTEGSDLSEFLESHDVKFTTQEFSPEPQKQKKITKELEKFADEVTRLVEERCTPQTLEDLIKELVYEPDERVEYLGTFIYAIVRGCLVIDTDTESESEWKLSSDALNKYSSVLTAKHENQDAIALKTLTALTILWHSYNCPQHLLITILLALHNQGTVSYENLKSWLESESLNNIPGIGAARLNSKRYIQDLGAKKELET